MITVVTRFCSLTAVVAGRAAAVGVAPVIMGAVWGITRGHKGKGQCTVGMHGPAAMYRRRKTNQRTRLKHHNRRHSQRRLRATNLHRSGSCAPALARPVGNFNRQGDFCKFTFGSFMQLRSLCC